MDTDTNSVQMTIRTIFECFFVTMGKDTWSLGNYRKPGGGAGGLSKKQKSLQG